MQKRLPKTKRVPGAFAGSKITDRSCAVIDMIARYRFVLARDIVRVVGGNEDVTHRHLQQLYHRDLIGRFCMPLGPNRGEFIYFLDNAAGLRKLCTASALNAELFDWDEISRNRQKYGAAPPRSAGQLLFIEHELMISRFHADVDTAARADGNVQLERWVQGSELWNTVQVDSHSSLPHRPDALFTLKFPNAPVGQQRANFFYEADRSTASLARIEEKLIAHIQFLRQEKQVTRYGFRKIRAVLVQTITEERSAQLREITAKIMRHVPFALRLFWFSSGTTPGAPLARIWACTSDVRLRSLID